MRVLDWPDANRVVISFRLGSPHVWIFLDLHDFYIKLEKFLSCCNIRDFTMILQISGSKIGDQIMLIDVLSWKGKTACLKNTSKNRRKN